MQPNILLICKLLFLLLMLHGFYSKFGDPYLPFLKFLDWFHAFPGWYERFIKGLFWLSGLALLFNFRVRSAALGLGISILLTILGSKPLFQNHVFIVCCIFILAGLHRKEDGPVLFQFQFAIIYFGAFLNKALQPDWWTGDFMHTWLHLHLKHFLYEILSPLLPNLWFAVIISVLVILSELGLAILFMVKRWNGMAVSIALIMHLVFLGLIGGPHFGYFTEDILLALLAFLHWPETPIVLGLRKSLSKRFAVIISATNWDRQFRLSPIEPAGNTWMEVRIGEKRYSQFSAIFVFLKYNVATYIGLFVLFKSLIFIAGKV